MNDENKSESMSDEFPDRLSVDPNSPSAERGSGALFKVFDFLFWLAADFLRQRRGHEGV